MTKFEALLRLWIARRAINGTTWANVEDTQEKNKILGLIKSLHDQVSPDVSKQKDGS